MVAGTIGERPARERDWQAVAGATAGAVAAALVLLFAPVLFIGGAVVCAASIAYLRIKGRPVTWKAIGLSFGFGCAATALAVLVLAAPASVEVEPTRGSVNLVPD